MHYQQALLLSQLPSPFVNTWKDSLRIPNWTGTRYVVQKGLQLSTTLLP